MFIRILWSIFDIWSLQTLFPFFQFDIAGAFNSHILCCRDEYILEESYSGDSEEDTSEATDDHNKSELERLRERKEELERARRKEQARARRAQREILNEVVSVTLHIK